MRKSLILLAAALAACGQQNDDVSDMNIAIDSTGDVPIERKSQPPAAPPANGVPAPPQNEASPAPEPPGEVTLGVRPTRASAGSTVTLTLANGSRQTIGYNLCTSDLQTASGSSVQTDRVCTMELRTLEPGRNATYSYELPSRLTDGRYRFSTGLDRMQGGRRSTVTSNTFEVR